MMYPVPLLLLALVFSIPQQAKHQQSDEIDKDEIQDYLAKQYDCQPDQIYFGTTESYDFLRVGYDQFVVVAGTCMTGTAGPDVHSVYTRDEKGELKALPMEKLDWKKYAVLFGNANSTFAIDKGLLVESWHDGSDRDDPLVVKYRWSAEKQKFAIVKVEAAGMYKTSYDCSKAKDTDLAICYVETLADLDVELAQLYKAYLAALAPEARKQAIEEEREWLAERNRGCMLYKAWSDCLEQSYKKRIAELQTALKPLHGN
jgi:uncharacterized protein YecT (DUF1311 family)